MPTGAQKNGTLLAVVGVEKANRVVCQALGCGHGVYRRIHVVRHDDGTLGVYGSDCFDRLFGHHVAGAPHYGSGEGRELTLTERQMLADNTEQLIAQFEAEHQTLLERERQRQEQQAKVERASRESVDRLRAEAERSRPPSAEEIARVEPQAQAIVRQKYGLAPELPGWRGLVLIEARKLLGR